MPSLSAPLAFSRSIDGIRLFAFSLRSVGDWHRQLAKLTSALPLDQVSKAFRQDQGCGAHLDDLDFASCDEKIEGTATYAREPACIGNPHADGLDCKRRRRRRGKGLERHNGALAEQL